MRRTGHVYLSVALTLDALLASAAWLGCYAVRFHAGVFAYVEETPPAAGNFARLLPIVLLCNLAGLGVLRLYGVPRMRAPLRQALRLISAAVLGWLATVAALYYVSATPYSRIMLFLFLLANPLALLLSRALVTRLLHVIHCRLGAGVRHAVIIGTGRLAQETLHRIRGNPCLGLRVAYFIDAEERAACAQVHGVPVAGALPDLAACLTARPVDAAFVAVPARKAEAVERILQALLDLPISVAVVPDFTGVLRLNSGVGELEGLPVVQLRDSPIGGWRAVVKRTIDFTGALALLAIFALPMLCLALLVKLTSPGPVLYRQERMGLGGRPFTMLKFRSMRLNAEHETGPVWAHRHDARRTRLGVFMRRTSLDELPQLFNVLVGEMSLVGPRPERPHFVREFVHDLPGYMQRYNVKAGLTGWAQVRGLRGQSSLKKRLQYDLYYINNWSLGFDLFILAMTPFSGMVGRNAY